MVSILLAALLAGCASDRAQISALDAKIARAPNDVDLLLERARLFTVRKQPERALLDCQRAMKIDPASVRARIQCGEALLDLGRAKEASALQVSADLVRAKDRHVPLEALRELGELDRRAKISPDDPAPLVARSKTLRSLRQFGLALSDAGAALALDDEHAPAHREAALSLGELGHITEARAEQKRADELAQARR